MVPATSKSDVFFDGWSFIWRTLVEKERHRGRERARQKNILYYSGKVWQLPSSYHLFFSLKLGGLSMIVVVAVSSGEMQHKAQCWQLLACGICGRMFVVRGVYPGCTRSMTSMVFVNVLHTSTSVSIKSMQYRVTGVDHIPSIDDDVDDVSHLAKTCPARCEIGDPFRSSVMFLTTIRSSQMHTLENMQFSFKEGRRNVNSEMHSLAHSLAGSFRKMRQLDEEVLEPLAPRHTLDKTAQTSPSLNRKDSEMATRSIALTPKSMMSMRSSDKRKERTPVSAETKKAKNNNNKKKNSAMTRRSLSTQTNLGKTEQLARRKCVKRTDELRRLMADALEDAEVLSKMQEVDLEIRDIEETATKREVVDALQKAAGESCEITVEAVKSLRRAYGETQIAAFS
uniref:Uncharacterized protein n=1 Tax=Timema poppense TaxID=170557 RepID=A0A7R9GU06_TIMPO|nr:unnamed protein product [Timema poppensis]